MNLAEMLLWSSRMAGCDEVPADSQVYVEAQGDVRRVLVGIDITSAELLYARDAGYDAVIAHHPVGERARIDFPRVVRRQVGQMIAEGVAPEVAERAVESRLQRVRRAAHMSNYMQVVDTARLIGVPFCNVHLPCDLMARQAVIDLLRSRDHDGASVAESLDWLGEFPEMEAALTDPEVWIGGAEQPLGRWTVAMAGGTNGGYEVFREYWAVGVDTIFSMHAGEEDLMRLAPEAGPGKNLVVTGHLATDSVGVNMLIAALEGEGVEVTRTSGVIAP